MSRIRAITFDVTGTLLKFKLSPPEYYCHVGNMFGIQVEPITVAKNFRLEWKRMSASDPNFGRSTGLGWEQWWRQIVIGTFTSSSRQEFRLSTLHNIADYLIASFQTSECWVQYPGVVELLRDLKKRNVALGVLSNNDERLDKVLTVMKLRDYFTFVLTSYEAGFQKPDKQIFNLAHKLFYMEGLSGQHIAHVGNEIDSDYLGAEQAGWNGVLIHVDPEETLKLAPGLNPRHIFKDFFELKQRLNKRLSLD